MMTMRKCWFWGSQGNGNEEYNLQGCNMVNFRDVSPPSSGSSKIPAEAGNKLNSVCIMFLQHVRLSDVREAGKQVQLSLVYSSALKMPVLYSSETSSSLWPTWHYNPEDHNFQWGKASHCGYTPHQPWQWRDSFLLKWWFSAQHWHGWMLESSFVNICFLITQFYCPVFFF